MTSGRLYGKDADQVVVDEIADCVYFAKGWEDARGCRIEHFVAAAYGAEIMYERW